MPAAERIERYIGPDADVGTPDVASSVLRKHLENRLILHARYEHETTRHQAAIFLLAGFNDGFLLEHLTIRRQIRMDSRGAAVYFGKLREELEHSTQVTVPLGSISLSTLDMCCALSLDEFAFPALGPWLAKLDGWNAWVISVAFGIATDQTKLERPSALRELRMHMIAHDVQYVKRGRS